MISKAASDKEVNSGVGNSSHGGSKSSESNKYGLIVTK